MREILFRAKAINREEGREYRTNYKNGDWVCGLVSRAYHDYYSNFCIEMTNEDGVSGIDVDYNTLGQYTGLTDKNGTKIFEGDILDFGGRNFHVFWNGESYQWQATIKRNGFDFPVYDGIETHCPVECVTLGWIAAEVPIIGSMSTEIVGNIYDNPELLED